MISLVVTTPDGRRQHLQLTDASLHIGRSGRNDLVIDDPTVSRVHAEILRGPGGHCLVDLGARCGTLLNGVSVAGSVHLHPGDRIRLGRTTIVFGGDTNTPVDITPTPMPTGPGTTMLGPDQIRLPALTTPFPAVTPSPLTTSGTPATLAGPAPAALRRRPSQDAAATIMELVLEADRQMLFHRPIEQILEAILDLAGRTIGYERAALMLVEKGRLEPKVVRTPPAERGVAITISSAIVERVLHRRESILTSDALRDTRFNGHPSLVGDHIRSVMCVPLRDDDKVLGLLYVDSRESAGLFTGQDLRILAHLASVAAVKIENARLFDAAVRTRALESEMLQAAAIVDHLLPADAPAIPGYEVFGHSVPCRHVGGDSYDYIALPGGRHILTLGDVAGKGLPAALLMCCFHSAMRALAASGLSEQETMSRLNRLLHARFPPNRFTTCFFAVLDPERHHLTYVNAGQETPFILRRAADPLPLPPAGMPLGLFDESEYAVGRVTMDPGDVLLCYSDGVTEGLSPAEEMFGQERLLSAAAGAAGGPAATIAAAVTAALERHHAGRPHEDDITMLVLRRSE